MVRITVRLLESQGKLKVNLGICILLERGLVGSLDMGIIKIWRARNWLSILRRKGFRLRMFLVEKSIQLYCLLRVMFIPSVGVGETSIF